MSLSPPGRIQIPPTNSVERSHRHTGLHWSESAGLDSSLPHLRLDQNSDQVWSQPVEICLWDHTLNSRRASSDC